MSLAKPYLIALFLFLINAAAQTAFFDDFEGGFLNTEHWRNLGSPNPVVLGNMGYQSTWALDCNGDNQFVSGTCLLWNLDLASLPRYSLYLMGHQSKYHWQSMETGFSWTGHESFTGSSWNQPGYLFGFTVEPKISSARMFCFVEEDSLVTDWIPEIHNDVWMSVSVRVNPDGTVSFLKDDTLVFTSSVQLDLDLWSNQAFALKGQSFNHVQLMDDVCVSPFSLREGWEEGLNFVFWKAWGDPEPEIVSGAGWQGSVALDCNGSGGWFSGVASYHVFNLAMLPTADFRIMSSGSTQGDMVEVGWSLGNALDYQGTQEQPGMLASISVSPGDELVTFTAGGESQIASWPFNGTWVNCTIRINSSGTVSFLTADTLRWTSGASINPAFHTAQSLVVQGISSGTPQYADEILVYPSFYLPGGFVLPLNSIHFIDEYMGWAVGDHGAIVHTEDGGATWEEQPAGVVNNLNDVHFETPERGWCCSDSGVILTTFNGEDWIPCETGFPGDLQGISLAGTSTGWAAGSGSLILKTDNGGFNWSQQACPFTGDVTDVDAVNTVTAFATGTGGHAIRTTDGVNWSETPTGVTVDLNGVSFVNELTGWAVGDQGTILKTSNGGNSWTQQASNVTDDLYSVSFFDESHGWIVGAAGIVLYSENSGESWVLQPGGRNSSPDLRDVHACTMDGAWGVSGFGLHGYTTALQGVEEGQFHEEPFSLTVNRNPCFAGESIPLEIHLNHHQCSTLSLVDLSGRILQKADLNGLPEGVTALNLQTRSETPAGVYFCVLSTPEESTVHSVVILPEGRE